MNPIGNWEAVLRSTIWLAALGGLAVAWRAGRRGLDGLGAAAAGAAAHLVVATLAVALAWSALPLQESLFFTAYALATSVLLVLPIVVIFALWSARRPATARRRAAAVALAGAALAALLFAVYAYRIEPYRLVVEEVEVESERLPAGVEIRIAHASDAQFDLYGPHEERAISYLRGMRADIAVFTGDLAQGRTERALAGGRRFLAGLAKAAPPGRAFGVTGNIETDQVFLWPERGWRTAADVLRSQAAGTGVAVLESETAVIDVGGLPVVVAGVDHARPAPIPTLLAGAPAGALRIVIVHHPDAVLAGVEGADLVLAGHTHGGQVRIPGFGAITTLTRLGRRYASGLFRFGGTYLYINGGIGMERSVAPRIRTFCPPEVALVRVRGTGPARPTGGA